MNPWPTQEARTMNLMSWRLRRGTYSTCWLSNKPAVVDEAPNLFKVSIFGNSSLSPILALVEACEALAMRQSSQAAGLFYEEVPEPIILPTPDHGSCVL